MLKEKNKEEKNKEFYERLKSDINKLMDSIIAWIIWFIMFIVVLWKELL